jgi:two-component system, OmpR family, sensor kinase
MTRRVVIAIIINVWLVLITAGCSTYFITRALLLADLDDTIASRVVSLPGIERERSTTQTPNNPVQDRYVMQDRAGRRITSLVAASEDGGKLPTITTRGFTTLADGTRLRTLTLAAHARPVNPGDDPEPVTVVYSAPTKHVDALLRSLLYSFSFFGILAAVASALAAQSVAKAALRPMRDTAELLGKIDERSLNRRVEVTTLPPELAPIGAKLNDMLARLETAFAQRRQFIADASHELRTPVAALVTALEVALRRKRDVAEYARVLEQTLTDARLLNQLVVTLVEQARSERFGENPEFGPLALEDFLKRCAAMVLPLAQRKNLTLDLDLAVSEGAGPEAATFFSDETMLRSAVVNLLSNAVEYTPERGRVVLAAHLRPHTGVMPESLQAAVPEGLAGERQRLVIVVRDNGPGISPDHMPNIFEPFYRANTARTDAHHHLGLGLALVRLNVRSMGGDCRVESPPAGQSTGCEFVIELPTLVLQSDNTDQPEGNRVTVNTES